LHTKRCLSIVGHHVAISNARSGIVSETVALKIENVRAGSYQPGAAFSITSSFAIGRRQLLKGLIGQ